MSLSAVSLAYRRAALQHASPVGMVIALHDTLAGNLARAAAAMERGDIPTRCAELVHGFKVLQQLDAMLDMDKGGEAAINIRRFYTHLRGQMLAAQFKLAPNLLHQQLSLVLDVRGAWQQLDSAGSHTVAPVATPPLAQPRTEVSAARHGAAIQVERASFSCSG